MYRKIVMTAVMVCLMFAGVEFVRGNDVSLLKNGGFEKPDAKNTDRPATWITEGNLCENNPHSGKCCLLLENTKGGWFSAVQVIKNLPPDRYYMLTFFYRAEGGTNKLPFSVSAYSRTGVPESFVYMPRVNHWHPGCVDFYSGKGGSCNINFTAHSSGKSTVRVWVDDIVVKEKSESDFISSLLLDPGFESGEIGKMAIGWQRMSLKTPNYARLEIDATQFHSGNRCLRIDFPENGYFLIRSHNRITHHSIPYTFSIWAKATKEGTKLSLGINGLYSAGRTFTIGKNWQKLEFTFAVPQEKFAGSETKHVMLAINSGRQKAETTIWIDDTSWEVKKTESKAENLLPNGSFEFAANSSFADWWGCNSSSNLVPFYEVQGRDNSTAVHGNWSHKVKAQYITLNKSKSLFGSDIEIRFPVPGAASPTDYVLSAYLKSDREDMRVRFSIETEFIRGKYTTEVNLTEKWERYSLHIPLDEKSTNSQGTAEIRVNVTPLGEGTYWVDAVQFEKGTEPNPYRESTRYTHLWGPASYLPKHEGTPPAIRAVFVKDEPVIDGRLDDPVWKKAAHVKDFILNRDAVPASQKTEAWILFTPDNLCIAFKCYDDRMDKIKADVKKRNGPVYADDCVEVFIDTTHDHDSLFQFTVNTINTQFCMKKGDIKWDAEWKSGIAKSDGFWTAEISIPVAVLEMDKSFPSTWGINFCRENHKIKEYSTWSFVKGSFLTPTRFGHLEKVPVKQFSKFFWRLVGTELRCDDPVAGRYNLKLQIKNLFNQRQKVTIETILLEREEELAAGNPPTKYVAPIFSQQPLKKMKSVNPFSIRQKIDVSFKPESIATISTDSFELGNCPKPDYRLCVRVMDKRDKSILYERQTVVAVPALFDAYFERSFYMKEPVAILIAHVFGCEEDLLKRLSVKICVDGPEKMIIKKKVGFPKGSIARLNINISHLPEGLYPARIELLDSAGNILKVKQDTLTKLPFKSYAVPVDRKTRTILVDGKPFIPYFFCLYPADLMRRMIPEIASAGFNGIVVTFTQFYGYESPDEEIQMFLDDCQRYGLKVIYWFKFPVSYLRQSQKKGMDAWTDAIMKYMEHIIPKFRDHPAIIAWKIIDEWWDEKMTGEVYNLCRKLDPYRPAYLNTCSTQVIPYFRNWLATPNLFTDIFSGDIYPFGRFTSSFSNIEKVAQYADAMIRIAARNHMPVYMWCQGFGNLGAGGWFREPTPAEQESMVSLLKMHGLTGIYYFANRPNVRECWDTMVSLGKEMKIVDPILLGKETEKQLRLFKPNIHAAMVEHQGKLYLFVAHASPEPCSFAIPLSVWGKKSGGQAGRKFFLKTATFQ